MNHDDVRADLAHIRRLMEDTRRATVVGGGYFIAWGIAIGLGLLVTWLRVAGHWEVPPFGSWIACLALGGIATCWLVQREKRDPVQAPGGRLIGLVWLAMGISVLVLFFAGVGSGNLDGRLMPALSSVLVGGAVFLTGMLSGLNWLRNLAAAWWLGATAMLLWPGPHVLLLMGAMLLALYVIPGIVLIRMRKRAP